MSDIIIVRRLNEDGITLFSNTDWGATDSKGNPPSQILYDDNFSEIINFSDGRTRSIDSSAKFTNYEDMFDLIDGCLGTNMDLQEVNEDKGLWAWFSLLYYEQLRKGTPGSWKAAAMARFIPSGSSADYFRVQIYMAYAIVKMHGKEASAVFLFSDANNWSEVQEQFLCVQSIISSTPLISSATELYYDYKLNKAKIGTGGQGPGSPRRFIKVYWQLYGTYDLKSMNSGQILDLLPNEFDKFKNSKEN